MKNRYTALLLALLILAQVFAPEVARAKSSGPSKQTTVRLVKMGALDPKTYPKLDNKTILAIQKQARENIKRAKRIPGVGLFSVNSPYLPGQNPTDGEKAAAYGKLKVKFKTFGLKENGAEKEFQWNEIFGTDSNGKPGTADIYFVQRDAETREEKHRFKLAVNKAGDYTLEDIYGNPALLPLYSTDLKPYKYEVELDTGVSEKITLLTVKLSYSGDEVASFVKDSDGKIVATIPMDLQIAQTASTRFVSEWHADVSENDRPAVNGDFDTHDNQDLRYFPFPKNNADVLKLRMESYNLETDDYPGYDPQTPPHLRVVPEVNVDEDMLEDPATYSIDKNAKRITATDGKVYKYDLQYDVINGGKLTMTEILPVTFDANGGKFASITEENAEQKIVKEVEYDKDLTDKVENPTKPFETFKGWATAKDGKPLSEEALKASIKNIKEAKTLYAIWDNNAIKANELEVKESFKDKTGYVNDFIPSLDTLKGQVKIMDADGKPQPLANDDTLAIVNGTNEYTTDEAAKDYLYNLLKEEATTEVSRDVTVKAKITHQNGTSQTVDIPIKVIKNIYEAKTEEGKTNYVPDGYVKVTVDPTTKAEKPQKYFYYVNPNAQVVIPKKEDPKGTDNNQFTKWLIDGTTEEYKLAAEPRHQFKDATTITAQYVSDVIPAKVDGSKPEGTPENFVKVTFVPTVNATDTTEKIFYVNPDKKVTIPVKNPVGKQYFTFKEWKIGDVAKGETYTVGTPKQFTDKNGTTITATYTEAENIIPYDPKEPTTRPEGYVRVTFEADTGLKLTEIKAYYVKQNAKDAQGQPLTLANAELAKPGVSAETGYKFENKWKPEDTTKIETTDIVVKAKATPIPDTVEKKDGVQKPAGYVEVKFVAGDNGKLTENNADIAEKVYFVNPNKYVTFTPPTAKGNTGYEFGAWDKDPSVARVYTAAETTITANFNELKAEIPKTRKDDSEKPAGYVTVTFELVGEGGALSDTKPTVYFVNPNKEVYLNSPLVLPAVGYEFKGWKPELELRKYTEDTKIEGTFKKLDDIIPATKSTPKPDGYVTVTFINGRHGTLDENSQTVYYVNPKAGKTVGNLTKPKVNPNVGYEFTNKWSHTDTAPIKENAIIEPGYKALDDVIPQKKTDGTDKHNGYITVTFEKGNHGKELTGQAVYYVNPNKVVVLEDKAPKAVPNTGYTFARWDTSIEKAIQYKDGDKITALYNEPGTISKTEIAGYVKVEFKPGTNGKLDGTTEYWIKPGVKVNIPAPTVNPNVGYKFDKWDNPLTVTKQLNDSPYTITANYAEEQPVIPKTKTDDSEKPNGYVTVNFVTDGNGSLRGTTTYFVNPNKEADFTQIAANMTKKPKIGYTEKGGSWAPTDFKQTFSAPTTEFKFSFAKLNDVIPVKENEAGPEGYVTVTLIPTDKATDQTKAKKSYWVKANTDISITSKPTGKEETINDIIYTYTFKGWEVTRGTIASWDNETIAGKFIQDTEITAKYSTKVDYGDIVPAPVPKDNVITGKGNEPEAKDLIKNIPGSLKDPLPQGTTFKYTDDGKPNVKEPGKTKAKVEVKYPNGNTVVVEVPITVEKNVVPQTGTDKPTVPDNYVKVEFVIDPAKGGKIADNETKVYYVNPNQDVTIPQPKTVADTGYSFNGWDKDTTKDATYTTNTIVKGSFKKGNDIVPQEKTDGSDKPVGYVTVTFDKGEHGTKIEGQTVFYVNPKANPAKTLGEIAKPTVTPDTGFTFAGWDKEDTTEIKTDITVTAQYQSKNDVVPKTRDDDSEKPEGYITVTFDTTDKGGNVTKVVFVNPNKPVVLKGYEPQGFEVKKGYRFAGWDTSINQAIQYQNGTIIKAVYNDPWKISTTEVQGYAKVEFKPGDHGKLIGVTDYWVKPGEDVYLPAPAVEPNTDYRFAGWNKSLTVNLKEGDPTYVITATYAKIEKPKEPERIVDTRVETRVVEVPVRDRNYRKEVWYMCGFGGDFRPHDGLKRSEAAQILANALREDGYKYDPHYPIAYKDVGKNWYAEAVRITTQANVFVGYPDGYFRPDDKISTVEWIATLRRFQQIAKEDGNHMNLRTGHWATGEIEAAYKAGWLGIYPQGLATFKADTPMPREEVAAVSNRAFNRVMDRDYIRRNDKNMTHYRDVNPSMWSYDDILLASNTFMHDGRFFKAHGITQDNVIFNVNIDGLTITQDLFQRVKR